MIAATNLTSTNRAGHHRIDDFQMRGVEGQGQVQRPTWGRHVGRETHVVLHVTGMGGIIGMIKFALEFLEQLLRRLAEDIDQYVQAPAMGHADDDVLHAIAAGPLDQGIHQRDQAVATFQREALLADVLGVQIAFETFGGGQPFEDPGAAGRIETGLAGGGFQPRIQPPALLGIGDVHELGTDRTGVGRLQMTEQVFQLQSIRAAEEIRLGVELAVQVGRIQPVEGDLQVRCRGLGRQAERIEIGLQMAA